MTHATVEVGKSTRNAATEGYVYIRNIFTGEKYKTIDIAASATPNGKDFYYYARIITYQGVSFGTGLNLTFYKTDKFIQDFIKEHSKDYKPDTEFTRFVQLHNRYFGDKNRVKIARYSYS